MRPLLLLVLIGLALLYETQARAYILSYPSNLAQDVLSETDPTAFAPAPITTEDYVLHWSKPGADGLAGVKVSLAPESLQWVRVADVLVVPRARFKIEARNIRAGAVSNQGFHQELVVNNGVGEAELPIALISGPENAIEITLNQGGQIVHGQIVVQFNPRKSLGENRVYYDASCSRYGLHMEASGGTGKDWMYVGCRIAQVKTTGHRTASLEAYVFWDGVGKSIQIDGIDTPSSSAELWLLRLRSEPGVVKLRADGREVTLHYAIPEHYHAGLVGMGLGPYAFTFQGAGENVQSLALMPTIYASYSITESMRMTAFDGTTLNDQLSTNLGVYFNSEYLRAVDKRMLITVMLGATMLGYQAGGQFHPIFSAPQGMELTFSDFFGRGTNLTLGGFVYPAIAGTSYYNTWIRWGKARFFAELNYISWQQVVGSDTLFSRSIGVSIGFPFAMPLFTFL